MNKVRNLLAFAGGGMQSLDSSFTSDSYTGVSYNRMGEIENGDNMIVNQFAPQHHYPQQPPQQYYIPPVENQYNNLVEHHDNNRVMNKNNISREERINRFLGKATPSHQDMSNNSLDKIIKNAISPIEDRLEDTSVLLGLVVQRLEQLINIVDDNPQYIEQEQTTPPAFQEEETFPKMEVYDPEVSMVFTEDEEESKAQVNTTKKRKKK